MRTSEAGGQDAGGELISDLLKPPHGVIGQRSTERPEPDRALGQAQGFDAARPAAGGGLVDRAPNAAVNELDGVRHQAAGGGRVSRVGPDA